MEMLQIEAKKRDTAGTKSAKKLRAEGMLPCVLYGYGAEVLSLALHTAQVAAFFRQSGRILDLDVEGNKEQAIIKDIQYDSMGSEIIHLDLIRIKLDEVISISVPVKIKGTAKGIDDGGIQEVLRNEIQIKVLPTQIPEFIVVDVSELGLQEALHLGDLTLPEGVELDEDPGYTVVSIVTKAAEPEPGEEPGEGEEGAEPSEGEDTPADGGDADSKEKKGE